MPQTFDPGEYPTIISFAAGDDYYHRKARELATQLTGLGLNHSIKFFEDTGDLDWAQLCRLKIQFYRDKMEELNAPLLWIDADSTVLTLPSTLKNCQADFGAMLRNTHLRDFDPYKSARMWSPSVLYFNNSDITKSFLDKICEVESQSIENITDDFALHEAWMTYEEELSVLVIPRKHVAMTPEAISKDTWVVHGHSGNVTDFKSVVVQHDTIRNKGEVLSAVASDAMKQKNFVMAESLLLMASSYEYDHVDRSRRLAETLRHLGRPKEASAEVRGYHERNPDDLEGKLVYGRQMMREGKLTTAERLFTEVADSNDPKRSGLATSLLFDLRQDRKAKLMKVSPGERTRVWWMKQPYPGNLGDILNPYIIEKITGIPPRMAPRGKGMLAIGSVIKFAETNCDVWGTGTPRMTDEMNPTARYHAVRGPLTRELVLRGGGECPEVYGDPALLMPRIYSPNVQKKYRLGVIRHVRQRGLGKLAPGVRDLNLLRVGYEEIEMFIDELLECEFVVSTSLHGIILAHAYGIPARWAEFSDTSYVVQGDGTKYLDYLRSVGLPDQTPLDLSQFETLSEDLIEHVDPECSITFDGDALLAAFPGVIDPNFLESYNKVT